jgi:hypothetical protein
MTNPEYEHGGIFNHPDLVELERHANDPETIRLMKEVREFDEALRDGRLTDITDVARVTAELNDRWASHIGEQVRLSGTVYVSDDESTEVKYVQRALMYFSGFVVTRTRENGCVDRHARYALSMQKRWQ